MASEEIPETVKAEQPATSTTLHRGLSVRGVVALAVSDITPMASLLIIAPVVLAAAGTGAMWAYLVGCFLAINVALCMGELGSMYPVAGGLYSIVHRVLGRPIGFLALVDYIAQGVFLPASIALGVGTYLHALNDAIPVNLSSAIAMAVVTLLAVLRIQVGAILVAIFLAIEVVVIVVVAVAGFTHWNQPWSILSHPVIFDDSGLSPVGLGAIVAALAITMFSVNGCRHDGDRGEDHTSGVQAIRPWRRAACACRRLAGCRDGDVFFEVLQGRRGGNQQLGDTDTDSVQASAIWGRAATDSITRSSPRVTTLTAALPFPRCLPPNPGRAATAGCCRRRRKVVLGTQTPWRMTMPLPAALRISARNGVRSRSRSTSGTSGFVPNHDGGCGSDEGIAGGGVHPISTPSVPEAVA
jgi:hypothetical protein